MLALLLSAGDHRYALPCREVREVISCVALMPLARAPLHVAGVLNYRGIVTPVADFCMLATGKPCSRLLSSRIVLFDFAPEAGRTRPVGLLAERVTETRELELGKAADGELSSYGSVVVDEGSIINVLEPARLFRRTFAELRELDLGGTSDPHAVLDHRE